MAGQDGSQDGGRPSPELTGPPIYPPMSVVARLNSRALVRVTGPDAIPFLHNLLTQDVETLKPGELRFGALLTPQGRLAFDLFLWGLDDGVLLDVAAPKRDALIQRLGLYRLRADVAVTADDAGVFVRWPETAPGFVPDPRSALLGGRAHGDHAATATEADWQAHRLSVGVPDPVLDMAETTYPIEANFDLLNGIDFQKGCFIGQETTSRMKRRGTVKSRILPLIFDGPAPSPGTEVLKGDLRAGEVLSGGEGAALALLRLDRLDAPLTADDRPVTPRLPAWASPADFAPFTA